MKTNIENTDVRILKFFNETIDAQDMAKYIRRVNYILALTVIRHDENTNPINPEWADEGFYFLNELAEILDPQIYKE